MTITIDEAIETQETYLKGEEAVEHDKLIASMKLGIKAFKRLKACQEHHCTLSNLTVPGETED